MEGPALLAAEPMRALVAALPLLLAPAAFAALPAPGAAPQSTHVHIVGFAFDPATVSIDVGEGVEWDNHDAVQHTATSDDGRWSSPLLAQGEGWSHGFDTPGSFPYHCEVHPTMMGTVIVVDPDAPQPDLVVAGVAFADAVPGVEKTVRLTVRNAALGDAPASTAKAEYLYHGELYPIGSAPVPALAGGATATVEMAWRVAGKLGDFTVRATADSRDEVAEANEANNVADASASVLVPGVSGVDLLQP